MCPRNLACQCGQRREEVGAVGGVEFKGVQRPAVHRDRGVSSDYFGSGTRQCFDDCQVGLQRDVVQVPDRDAACGRPGYEQARAPLQSPSILYVQGV